MLPFSRDTFIDVDLDIFLWSTIANILRELLRRELLLREFV